MNIAGMDNRKIHNVFHLYVLMVGNMVNINISKKIIDNTKSNIIKYFISNVIQDSMPSHLGFNSKICASFTKNNTVAK